MSRIEHDTTTKERRVIVAFEHHELLAILLEHAIQKAGLSTDEKISGTLKVAQVEEGSPSYRTERGIARVVLVQEL